MPHSIDTEELRAAAQRCRSAIEALPTEEYGYKKIGELIDGFPGSVEAYYERLDAVEGGVLGPGATQFGFALVLADALGDRRTLTVEESDLSVSAPFIVYCGDLRVRGNLDFNGVLVVLGDLVVDGSIVDSHEWSSIWVTGSVRAKALRLGATAWTGRSLSADLVLLSRRGFCFAGEGTKAKVTLRNDWDGEGFKGRVDAEHQLDMERDEDHARAVLLPEFFDDDGMIEDEDEIVEAVLAGDPIVAAS